LRVTAKADGGAPLRAYVTGAGRRAGHVDMAPDGTVILILRGDGEHISKPSR
jgi:hypothetical protein